MATFRRRVAPPMMWRVEWLDFHKAAGEMALGGWSSDFHDDGARFGWRRRQAFGARRRSTALWRGGVPPRATPEGVVMPFVGEAQASSARRGVMTLSQTNSRVRRLSLGARSLAA
ncbi:MAG: hypothetical protein RML57_06015 [Acidobacteriota bacterium]|nr:hypothetical protein [Acidobacteriota bacterium]